MEMKELKEEKKSAICKTKNSLIKDKKNNLYKKGNFGKENSDNKVESLIKEPMKEGEGNSSGSILRAKYKEGKTKKAKSKGRIKNLSSLEKNFRKIDSILKNKDISDSIIEETKIIYSEVFKKLKIKGNNFNTMVYAMYFLASRRQEIAKSFKEIAQMFNIKESEIKNAFKSIEKIVTTTLTVEQQNNILSNYISNFCDKYDNNEKNYGYKSLAIEISKNINESGLLDGKNEETIAGLSLYIAMKLEKPINISKDKINKAFIRGNKLDSSYNQISDSFDKIIPEK